MRERKCKRELNVSERVNVSERARSGAREVTSGNQGMERGGVKERVRGK